MSAFVEKVVKVDDRVWQTMHTGVLFERWPGEAPPDVGDRVVVFDRDLEFTQHDVEHVDGFSVTIGPAIPWRAQRLEPTR